MPAATSPLGKKPAGAKPTGFTKPAGLSRQTAPAKTEEDEAEKGPQPVHIGISAVALILAGLFAWMVYKGDQTPNRVSDYIFGQPQAGADASGTGDDYDSDEDESGSDDESEDEE